MNAALERIRKASATLKSTAIIGAPYYSHSSVRYNAAYLIQGGKVRSIVLKEVLPNGGEYYEKRWFESGKGIREYSNRWGCDVGTRFIYAFDNGYQFGVEICEDLWAPVSPSRYMALAGAELILNLSASNELIGKAEYRRDLLKSVSAQAFCGYGYVSAGAGESSKDLVYGGHCLASELGSILVESERFLENGCTTYVQYDLDRIRSERLNQSAFRAQSAEFAREVLESNSRRVEGNFPVINPKEFLRQVSPHPFVPQDELVLTRRSEEIFAIQVRGLAERFRTSKSKTLLVGVSGGVDSSLAFLVCYKMCLKLGLDPAETIVAVTMPGPGTTDKTYGLVKRLLKAFEVPMVEIPITKALAQHLKDLKEPEDSRSIVYENAQARERTQILFNLANQQQGIVVGTGSLSEMALGWCTFNGDQMSNYSVNAAIPKTLVKYLIASESMASGTGERRRVLDEILELPPSPELLPNQITEVSVGPYELNDFFLFYLLRFRFTARKIIFLAEEAFHGKYSAREIASTWAEFLGRFKKSQFKRTTLPPGPKVGTVSLSPRGDWRAPDEIE
jgi:NAD+ synthase (glutamine-hydrolysing)